MKDEIRLTYDQWKRLGFFVVKGEKSTMRNADGVCLFTEDQVEHHEYYVGECSADASDLY